MRRIIEQDEEFSPLLNESISIAKSIQMRDFPRFFKLFKRTNYMFACLMVHYFEQMRKIAFEQLRRAYPTPVKVSTLQRYLLLEDENDAYNCLKTYGYTIKEDKTVNLSDRAPSDTWMTTVKKFTQARLSKLDDFTEGILKRDILKNGLTWIMSQDGKFAEMMEKRREEEKRRHEEHLVRQALLKK